MHLSLVDVFICYSGFLTFHLNYSKMKSKGIQQVLLIICNRWLRLVDILIFRHHTGKDGLSATGKLSVGGGARSSLNLGWYFWQLITMYWLEVKQELMETRWRGNKNYKMGQ